MYKKVENEIIKCVLKDSSMISCPHFLNFSHFFFFTHETFISDIDRDIIFYWLVESHKRFFQVKGIRILDTKD